MWSPQALANERLEMSLKDRENSKIQCEGWLKPQNVRAVHESQVQARLPGTCNWIWLNSTFKQWHQLSPSLAADRLLCISGTHGCGKSVLASSILDGIGYQTLFFSFSGTDTGRQSFDSFIRSFIWQLLQSSTNEKSLEIVRSLMLRGQPLVSELWDSFKSAAALVSAPVYCVIDGVDECCDPAQKFIDHILELLSAQPNFRVVLLGRPQLLRAAVGIRSRTIEINSDLTKQDICAYIDAEIGRHHIFDSLKLRDTVVEVLKEKSEGMFLWVKLMVDDLRKSDTLAQVEDRLRDLPRGIEKAYRLHFSRLVERLDGYELELAKNVFTWTIASLRPLEVEEFRHAYAIRSGCSAPQEENLLLQPDQRIPDVCGGLITVTNGVIRPIHFSLMEYLMRPEDEWLRSDESKIMTFRVDLQASHRSMGSVCVDYLTLCEYGSPMSDTDHFLQLGTRYPLLKYASLYTASHLSWSGPPCLATVQRIRDFLKSEKCPPWIEYLSMLLLADPSVIILPDDVERFISWLDQGGYKPELLEDDFLTRVIHELEERTRQFGEHDPRTEQCQLFLDILRDNISNSGAEEDLISESESQAPQMTSSGPSSFSHILKALNSNSALPLHRGVDMFLRLQFHLRHTKVLTDPLKMLFHLILQKAHMIPVYVLAGIGAFYSRVNKLEEALEVYRAAFAKVIGQETPIEVSLSESISILLRRQKKYEEAEAMCRQTLKLGQQLLGKEHNSTLFIANELAYILHEQERYEEAEALHQQTLRSRQRVLGKEHGDTLQSANNLAVTLRGQAKYEEAEALHRQTLESRQRILGKEHRDTLLSAHNLAATLIDQAKYEEAEALYRQTLESRQRILGKEHGDTLLSAHNLAATLSDQAKYEEAEALYRQTLESRQRILGKEHRDTLQSANDLAVTLRGQAKYGEAEALDRQTLESQQRILGVEIHC